jgi:hypothetical protein
MNLKRRGKFQIKSIILFLRKSQKKNTRVEKKDIKSLKEKLMKEFSTKEKLNREDLKRILNNLD